MDPAASWVDKWERRRSSLRRDPCSSDYHVELEEVTGFAYLQEGPRSVSIGRTVWEQVSSALSAIVARDAGDHLYCGFAPRVSASCKADARCEVGGRCV